MLDINRTMRRCPSCGGALLRRRRTWKEKLVAQAVFKCQDCGAGHAEDQWYLFLLGRVSRCPRCGTRRIQRLRKPDPIDPLYRNPFSYLQRFLGGYLHRCPYCRLQFYDVREKSLKETPGPDEASPVSDKAKSGE